MLEFREVGKRYGVSEVALDRVSLKIPRGQFCAVIGPSGAGKSTLLHTVNGMVMPSTGTILFSSIPITRKTLKQIRPRIGMIHQQFNLVDRLSVLSNVLTGALPHLSTFRSWLNLFPLELQRKACDIFADVGLEEKHLYRRASDLSGGQQQRVAIARAFLMNPDLVLADEPVASLDPKISEDILRLLRDASRRTNTAVLCSLHQVNLAKEYADRVVALHKGRIAYDDGAGGLTEDVLAEIYGHSSSVRDRAVHRTKMSQIPMSPKREASAP